MPDTEAYAPDTLMTDALGSHSKTLILTALLAEPDKWLTKKDIAHLAGIAPRTVREHMDTLEEYALVTGHPSKQGYRTYQINKNSDAAKHLAQFEWELINVIAENKTIEE